MKNAVTKRQSQLLSVIYEFVRDTGYPPTFVEMRERLGVSSNQSVIDLLGALERARLIRKSESAARALSILPAGYRALGKPALVGFVGMTSAGAPIEAISIPGEWKTISDTAMRLEEEMFILKIIGDSMINAGIDDGDAVLVQSKKEFITGEIVYAEIDGEGTIKRFISEDKPPFVYLKPENPKYDNIIFDDRVRLRGKVVSILKSERWQMAK